VTEFKVPELGENIESGDVTQILVKVGDTITLEQPVLELETDKATIEVPSSVAGVVVDIRATVGQKIGIGEVILTVDGGIEVPTDKEDSGVAASEDAGPVKEGVPAAVKTSAPEASEIVPITRSGVDSTTTLPSTGTPSRRGDVWLAPAAPSVRRLAREIGVNIADVKGSGSDDRISMDDVKAHAKQLLRGLPATASARAKSAAIQLPDFARWGTIERKPMTNIRRKTSEHLGYAWNTVAHVTQFDKADITSMEVLRRKYRQQVTDAGGNLTVTAILVKVLATVVKQFPQFNASLDPEANEIIYKHYVNVGVATDTERGLLVPVIRDADKKNVTEIAIEVHQMAERARNRKLSLEDMSGGGITISNLGGLGGTYFTPIVNWPEVAILGVSRGIIEPVWKNKTFKPRQLLPLSLSYDHRVIDGAEAMRFLREVVQAIEQPVFPSLLS
jgi:pyruvate dehydrogenase E2 component (dihydrolipoamide acetyltransferase)